MFTCTRHKGILCRPLSHGNKMEWQDNWSNGRLGTFGSGAWSCAYRRLHATIEYTSSRKRDHRRQAHQISVLMTAPFQGKSSTLHHLLYYNYCCLSRRLAYCHFARAQSCTRPHSCSYLTSRTRRRAFVEVLDSGSPRTRLSGRHPRQSYSNLRTDLVQHQGQPSLCQ